MYGGKMIHILFCGNDKVFDGILTCLLSILKRTDTIEAFDVWVFTMDATRIKPEYRPIREEQITFLNDIAKEYNPKNQIQRIDVTELYEREFAHCPNELTYCSPYTLIRLLADLVPGMPDKLLYLDVDILFNRDITLLYEQDVTGYEYAAARDHYGKYLLNPNFINAGVLLFNMQEMKETQLLRKSRELLKVKKLLFADESAIYRTTTRKKMLPQRYNDQKFLHDHTVIRHFSKRLFYLPYPHTANIKQWDISSIHRIFKYRQFDDILFEYIYLKYKFEREIERKTNV